ncbi:hypothetical protein PROFUN_08046 [Planoprotostelium fungivorum]|uniref:Uncharacterized protein n=1 Tax=Planoprotostelium fungivorum TaxID=1890364 RepID=A0A2P6NKH6_9EUKA|nr:hypothetical protein PROFUN_08046 [Planoprotostelium fungivorum]
MVVNQIITSQRSITFLTSGDDRDIFQVVTVTLANNTMPRHPWCNPITLNLKTSVTVAPNSTCSCGSVRQIAGRNTVVLGSGTGNSQTTL